MSLANIKSKQIACLNDIYASLEEQGATIPEKKNLVNVAPAIESIQGGNGPTFIDYIEGTGSQYIDTGYKPNSNTKVEAELYIIKPSVGSFLYGARNAGAEAQFGCYTNLGDEAQGRYGSQNLTAFTQVGMPKTINIIHDKNVITLGDRTMAGNAEVFSTNYNMLILGINTGGIASSLCEAGTRVFSFKIYDNGTLVRNFKPCTDSNGVYCLYDLVEKKYYYNQGTGEFRGEGWEPTQLEYIKSTSTSHGANYINLNLIPTNNTKLELSIKGKANSYDYWYGAKNFHAQMADASLKFIQFSWGGQSYEHHDNNIALSEQSYLIVQDKNVLTINGVVANTFKNTEFISTMPLHLLSRQDGDRDAIATLYYAKVWENDVLIRDLVPALNENNVAGLWDKSNKVFYENAGTGSFTAGPVIKEG